MKIDELVVHVGKRELKLHMQRPEGKTVCYILNCKGVGLPGIGKPKSVVDYIDRELVQHGAAMVYFSLRNYAKNAQSPSIPSIGGAALTLAEIAGQMRERYGTMPYAIGHSFGGVAVMEAAMLEETSFEGVILLNTPISNDEPLNSITRHWVKLREPVKTMAAYALCRAMNVDHHGSPVAVVERALDDSLERRASVTGPLSSKPVLILYGRRDAYQFTDAGIVANQTCDDYESRWKSIAPNARILGYEGLGHHFSAGIAQQVSVWLGYKPPQAARIAAEILGFVNA